MKIGVFGGTFDPPHVGHLTVAQDALERLGLDHLYFVPARVSPFKTGAPGTDPDLRAEMVEVALAGHGAMTLWRGELERPAPSYTVDTLREIRSAHRDASLFLLMGADQWTSFPGWRSPDQILELATVCVLSRESEAAAGSLPGRRLATRRMDVSSTEVRDRVRTGRSIRYLVPESVRERIVAHDLYGAEDPSAAPPTS